MYNCLAVRTLYKCIQSALSVKIHNIFGPFLTQPQDLRSILLCLLQIFGQNVKKRRLLQKTQWFWQGRWKCRTGKSKTVISSVRHFPVLHFQATRSGLRFRSGTINCEKDGRVKLYFVAYGGIKISILFLIFTPIQYTQSTLPQFKSLFYRKYVLRNRAL